MAASKELDDILSSALGEFDEEDEETSVVPVTSASKDIATAAAEAVAVTEKADNSARDIRADSTIKNLTDLMSNLKDEDFQKTLEETLKGLNTTDASSAGSGPISGGAGEGALDVNIAKTLKMLAETGQTSGVEGAEPAAMQAMGEDVMKKVMADFERMGEKEDFQGVVDGMMKQLLSKQIMYDPIKAICDKYPEWLAENQPKLSNEDYLRYGKQYQYIQRICAVYETTPDNFERLMELMQDMQECGKPPEEIIRELAPGLEFGSDGMPIMPNMGPGFPGMPGGAMPQIPGMGGQQQCALQ